MKPQRKAFAAVAAGTALGVGGLVVVAMPAGAGEAPQLPPIGAQELVRSTLAADTPAHSGTVAVEDNAGLPTVPGIGSLDVDSARVYTDGNGKSRLGVQQGSSERTIVHDGAAVWNYDSAANTTTKITLPPEAKQQHGATKGELADPTTAATQLLQKVRQTSTVAVDGTASVADRPAYELVLRPKPTERTVLREVRVAVDSATRLPLRLAVLTHGSTEPAVRIGFSELDLAEQPADLFQFVPPSGATVEQKQPPRHHTREARGQQATSVVGDGWDTVLTGRVPKEALGGDQQPGGQPEDTDSDTGNPRAMLDRIGTPVSGPFGTGHVITTRVGGALITDDGRFAAGAVPQQVLTEALGQR